MPPLWPDLDRWIAEGEMSEPSIMKNMDTRIQQCVGGEYDGDEQKRLKMMFDSASVINENKKVTLSESAFISLLTTQDSLPSSPEGVQAGKIIYASIAYFSTLPLPRYSDEINPQPEGLDFNQLRRGLEWAIPDRHGHIIGFGSVCQQHNMTDHLRFIFQSLASPTRGSANASEPPQQIKPHSLSTVEKQSLDEDSSMSYSDDGDILFEDLLDVLYSVQDVLIPNPLMAPINRDKFRPIAKQLMTENQTISFSLLAIPTKRFLTLIKALLFLQYKTPKALPCLNEFSGAASCLIAAFSSKDEPDIITWPMFEHGMRVVAPFLFNSYYNILCRVFLGTTNPFWLDASEGQVFIGSPNVLTIPLQSQLYTFLTRSFETLECFHHYNSSNLPTSDELVRAMETTPWEAIMLLSGVTSDGETVTFGLYSMEPTIDGSSIKNNVEPDVTGPERCSIFQLSPVQDVFRGIAGKPGWTFDDESVTIGEGDGVAMVLKNNLRKGEVRHQVSGGDRTTCTYEGNWKRGDWIVEFEIAEIAIWGESPDEPENLDERFERLDLESSGRSQLDEKDDV